MLANGKDEYVGMTAPTDKKAIYMGFVNIPFAIGWAVGDLISGPLYEGLSSKSNIATKFLIEHGQNSADLADLPQEKLMEMVQTVSGASDSFEATRILWDAYNPWTVWIVLGAIGVASLAGLVVFYYKSGMAEKDKLASEKALADADEASEDAAA